MCRQLQNDEGIDATDLPPHFSDLNQNENLGYIMYRSILVFSVILNKALSGFMILIFYCHIILFSMITKREYFV